MFPTTESTHSTHRRSGRSGITIIEILIVVVIIGLLATLAVIHHRDAKERAYVAAMMNDVRNFALANEAYFTDHGVYESDETLEMLGQFARSPDVETDSIDHTRSDGFFYRVRHRKTTIKCEIDYGRERENRVRCTPGPGGSGDDSGNDEGGSDDGQDDGNSGGGSGDPEDDGGDDDDGDDDTNDSTDDNEPPVAIFQVTASSDSNPGDDDLGPLPFVPWEVKLSSHLPTVAYGTGSYDPDGAIVAYEWSTPEDGVLGTQPILVHTFAPGVVSLTLTVTDDKGAIGSVTHQLQILDLEPPVPHLYLEPAAADEFISADASMSYDPDGEIVQYIYEFAQNTMSTTDEWWFFMVPGPGTYTGRLTVVDNDGLYASTTAKVTITPGEETPPVVHITCTSPVRIGDDVECWADVQVSPTHTIEFSEWYFYSGLDTWSELWYMSSDCMVLDQCHNPYHFTVPHFILEEPGFYYAYFWVLDDQDLFNEAYALVQVLSAPRFCGPDQPIICGQPPVAVIWPKQATTPSGGWVAFSAADSYDPDGHIVQYEFRRNGASVRIDDVFPVYGFQAPPAEHTVVLTVTDNDGNQAQDTATITVMGSADPPGDPPDFIRIICPSTAKPKTFQGWMVPSIPDPQEPFVQFEFQHDTFGLGNYHWVFNKISGWSGGTAAGNPVTVLIPFQATGFMNIDVTMSDQNGCQYHFDFSMTFTWN